MDVNLFSFPAKIFKSGNGDENRIPIEIIPNQPSFDRVNDKIMLKAFDEECVKEFLFDGVIDWDHKSILGVSPLEKAQAIVGHPDNLYIDNKRRVPICEGYLFKGNPYVENSILPILNSGSDRLGASLGGKILKKSSIIDPLTKSSKNIIDKIRLKHIAITPLQSAIHQGTSVKLKKSEDDYEYCFSSFESFMKSFSNSDDLEKALEAGNETDIAKLNFGQVLQKQSLEGDSKKRKRKKKGIDYDKLKSALPFIIDIVKSSMLKGGYDDFVEYFMLKGFNKEEAKEVSKLIAINSAKLI